jgi:hypothetical protein
MKNIKHRGWNLQINDVDEIIDIQQGEEYIHLQHEGCIFTQVKFEVDNFLVIDKFDREGDHIDSIGSHVFGENTYYQPEFVNGNPPINKNGVELFSFEVYRSKEECKKDFPNHKIMAYSGNDIEEPTFVDYE